jgi:hypothetical protein
MCRVPRLSDQRLRLFALTVEFDAYDDQLPSPPVGLGRAWHEFSEVLDSIPECCAEFRVLETQNQCEVNTI